MKLIKYISLIIFLFFVSCKDKEKHYRIEQYYFNKGKNNAGTMWHDAKKVNSNTYSVKMPDGFNPNMGFDSVILKIIEQ